MKEDKTITNLLDLDGVRYVVDEYLGLWVKFEVKISIATKNRPHGIRYSLTLHDRLNKRIMGFDNAHAIEYGGKKYVAPSRVYDHCHKNNSDKGQPYHYKNAGKLLEDFWREVDSVLTRLKEEKK